MGNYYVYIMANRSHVLYVGVTNDLERRVLEHKSRAVAGFTSRYSIDRLVYYELWEDIAAAIEREKQLKRWRRSKKLFLIESRNAKWSDLSRAWTKQ